jgi:PAT family beta-lactamase induction signal transducer AmpG
VSAWAETLRLYARPRMLAILGMGFASGLPLALTGQTLQIWLAESRVSLTDIGLFALVGVSYSLKFVWSPVLDRVPLPWLSARLGQRRSWLIAIGILLGLSIAGLGSSDPAVDPWRTALFAALVAFLSASQDIVIDAYRIELLSDDEQGAGAAATQWGYRFGMIASTVVALYTAEFFGWPRTYLAMAALVSIGLITVALTPEPSHVESHAGPGLAGFLRSAVFEPFRDFATRPRWLTVLVFIVLFRFGDALAGGMASAFYVQLGFSKLEIANVVKLFGVAATLLGVAAGGVLDHRVGTSRALVFAGVFAALSNFVFIGLAFAGHDLRALTGAVFVENFTSGVVAAAFVAYLSRLCSAEFTATQYALLSSLAATGRTVLAASAGWFAQQLGWPLFFALTALAATPGIALAVYLGRVNAREALPAPPACAANPP